MKTGIIFVTAALFIVYGSGLALDTTEAFDPGFSDVEVYAGYSGLGDPSGSSSWSFESLVGIGITGTFSTSISYSVESDGYLGNSQDAFAIGLFWTAYSDETLTFDLMGSTGTGSGVSLGFESNIDFQDFGMQLQIQETVENSGVSHRSMSTDIQPLVYFTIHGGPEILAAVDLQYADNESGEGEFDYMGTSVGMNIVISESIEFITQFDITDSEDDAVTAVSIGIVAGV